MKKKQRRRFSFFALLDYVRETLTPEVEPSAGCNKALLKPTKGETKPTVNEGIYDNMTDQFLSH